MHRSNSYVQKVYWIRKVHNNEKNLGLGSTLLVEYNKVNDCEWYNIYGGLVDGKWHRATKIDTLDELNNFMKRVSVGPKKMF